jgi:putative DNA primase/helicase
MLIREYGKDIRYNAAWKKWVVWTGKNWRIDDGPLIHERGLGMVQGMFILFGAGANGKSTFLNTVMNLLGDYVIAASTETFMKKNGEQISSDIARLRGTRFVTTVETEQGKRLSEPLIKQITGNDVMTARFLYGEFFDFIPTFKIFIF